MLGKPKFKLNDEVVFSLNEYKLVGKIYIIDAYGTFEQNEEVSYDIMVEKGNYPNIEYPCLFKHITESGIKSVDQ